MRKKNSKDLDQRLNQIQDTLAEISARLEQPVFPTFISRTELASILKITDRTIRNWESRGFLPTAYRIENVIRYKSEEVLEFLKDIREEQPTE